jgi:uncharacterized protein (TIGR03067 family)
MLLVCGLVSLGAGGLLAASARLAAGGKEKGKGEPVVAAMELTKVYATDAAGFDKKYKGKEVLVEGVVTDANAEDSGKRMVLLQGYQNPKEGFSYIVRVLADSKFEGLRIGHKIRVRGVCQGYKETLAAAELRDAKLVKVFADDFPPSAAVKEELKKLRGDWKVVGAEAEGQKLTVKDVGVEGFHISGRQLRIDLTGKRHGYLGLVVDPGKTPRTMDWVNPSGKKTLLIYELKGDRLRLAMPGPKSEKRLASFDSAKTSGLIITAERAKKAK